MNSIEYEISEIKKYELEIWKSGNCSGLAAIKVFDNSVIWDNTGCRKIIDYITVNKRTSVTDSFIKMLNASRKIVEAVSLASEYLVSENSISLDPDYLWFDENACVKLLPRHEEGAFIDRFCNMLFQIGANTIAEKIIEKNLEGVFSYKELLRFLSSWELELR